ncbi:hypothetical protein BST81_00445 [Leptolyngbya sp. 'hensonii']|uniref:DUF1361 domain-containing protein n=1 Tax=Leptolyngbya sp. 'hensonii' TaxID=1922337 RepID=UPI00094FA583|nr:DUF1361 domain-containing protein [Leptolyngbya sp. 'hensonii']OLP20248.1 hypothetical protein BST81_00445 [Leptolyngbya sp. 'hensonii']
MLSWLRFGLFVVSRNVRWMTWNLFLAFVPLGLSFWLFRPGRSRSLLWWIGLITFVAFLPNAPYVLTDIIHLINDIRRGYSVWTITLLLIPQYLLFMMAGMEAYVLSLINLGSYLKRQGWGKFVIWAELALHILSAIGIYLGRFLRYNSWDIVTRLDTLATTVIDDLVAKRPAFVMFITLVVITSLYWLMKQMTLAIGAYWHGIQANKTSHPSPL